MKTLTLMILVVELMLSGWTPVESSTRKLLNEPQRAASRSAPAAAVDADDLDRSSSEIRPLIERYSADLGNLNRFYAVPFSPTRRERLKQFYTDWRTRLDRLPFDGLSFDGKVDYLLFRNYLDYQLRQLDIQAKQIAEIEPLMPFASTIIGLEEARRRMEAMDPAKVAASLDDLNRQIEATRRTVETELRRRGSIEGAPANPIFKKTVANRAATALSDLRTTLRNWFTFYNGYDPLFTWWAEAPYRQVDQTLQSYITFLRERIVGVRADTGEAGADVTAARASPGGQVRGAPGAPQGRAAVPPRPISAEPGGADIIGDPIGREALMTELAREMIPYTPEELLTLAEREMAWCENEMKRASRDLGYGDDWKKALEYVKTRYVEPGKQPELVRDLALEAIRFLEEHDLVTIPPVAKETWRMEMMSPERQLVNPFFTGGEVITVSYPTNTMSHEAKMMSMRGNNRHFSRATVFHELIPGHHLQGFMTARYKPYRNLFSTPFWGEGWALYWELLLWDLGFHRSPEDRIGALFWRMHRCARIIFSLKFHLGEMTPEECIAYLVERVGHERANAEGEVRRSFGGQYGPLYQAAYLLGGLQFRALHRELVESGKMTNRAFHDAILKEGRIPVEMVRAILTRQPLPRDFRSSWRFYDLERR